MANKLTKASKKLLNWLKRNSKKLLIGLIGLASLLLASRSSTQ